MPPRAQPTERQRRLGTELKKLRLHSGLSGDKAAEVIDADRQRISNIEAGRVDVPRNGLYRLLQAYGCGEGQLFDGLMSMAQERGRGWWDAHRSIMGRTALDLAELESRSSQIHSHELLFIPGLLQTADYARAVCGASEDDRSVIDQYVSFRMQRQQILSGDSPVGLHAIVHEAALHAQPGGDRIMRQQLLKLIELSRSAHIVIQIFPYEAGMYSAFSSAFTLFGSTTPQLDTVHVEQPVSSPVVRDHDEVSKYADIFRKLSALALPCVDAGRRPESNDTRDSLSLIQHLLYKL